MKVRFILVLAVFGGLWSPVVSLAAAVPSSYKNEYLVQYRDRRDPVVLSLTEVEKLKLETDSTVTLIEPNFQYRAVALGNDYHINNQWYLKRIRADKAWTLAHDSADIVIAVIDSGVQINHPDLKDNVWINKKEVPNNGKDDDRNGFVDDINGWDFVNNVADPSPKFKLGYTADGVVHGTVVAGVLAASGNNQVGIAGVTWKVQIMALKALDDRGVTDTAKVVSAINYAIAQRVNVINLSFIGANYSRSLEEAIRRAYQAGIIVVAAGGNDLGQGFGQSLSDKPMYPVCLDGSSGENMVIGVAATDSLDRKANFSGYGKCIDIAAPGIGIYSTSVYAPKQNKSGAEFDALYDGYWSGTSLAVPIISGAVALLAQANPLLTPLAIRQLLMESAEKNTLINDSYANQIGAGRINLYSAVAKAMMSIGKHKNDLLLVEKNGNLRQWSLINEAKSLVKLPSTDSRVVSLAGELATTQANKIKLWGLDGKLISEWAAFEDNKNVSLSLASADVNGDGALELVAAIKSGAQKPEVRIFDRRGKLLAKFLAYQADFKGGVMVAAGDINNLGRAQIVTVPAGSGGAHIRVFNERGQLVHQFMAEGAKVRGNFGVAVSDVYSSLKNDGRIVFYYTDGSSADIKIFNQLGELRRRFSVSQFKKINNLSVTVADLDDDGRVEIACLVADKSGARLMIHRDNGILFKSVPIDSKLTNSLNQLTTLRLITN